MIRVEIDPVWRFRHREDTQSIEVVLDLLDEIRTSGKISLAAEAVGISYRHAWNLLERWSVFFQMPLVDRRRGSGTSLTPLGSRLVWASQRLEARLGPLLQNLSQELETEVNQLLPQGPLVLRVHASHGFAVPVLKELLNTELGLNVDFRYVGNQTALASLAHDACDLAGMHLPQNELRRPVIAASKGWLTPNVHRVIGFVTREMGLIVGPGNPLGITSIEALLRPDVRFVNRDPDSGTRFLFEELLALRGLDGSAINGYEHTEYTHAAVAAYVASGMADASFGVEAAARRFNLDFVRLFTEDYFFVCRKETLEHEVVKSVLEAMRGDAFRHAIARLPGYNIKDAGEIKTTSEVFRQ